MEARIDYSSTDFTKIELRSFIKEGLQDVLDNRLLDFDSTFDELEERYSVND